MSAHRHTHYLLHGTKHTSIDVFYADAKYVFNFPDYFGNNLDAFEECLRETVERIQVPIHIEWKDAYSAKHHLGSSWNDIVEIIVDVLHNYAPKESALILK
jgi:RNAse (barnase) inhibitor barstar